MTEGETKWWVRIGGVVGILALLATLATLSRAESLDPGRRDVVIFFADSTGTPRTDLWLVLVDGQRIEPDADGIARLPVSRAGEEASIRDKVTRREICALTIPQGGGETTRVTVPDQRTLRCR